MRRARKAARRLQRRLERFYELERGPDVASFVVPAQDGRETLLLRQTADALEIALFLPHGTAFDSFLQVVEGVSHFVYLAERARTGLPATQLELELQAEVDKFVLLALARPRLEPSDARSMHGRLYEEVRYLHPPHTEAGERYRLANDLAARFVARLFEQHEPPAMRDALRRFYRSGQTEKIRLARAA